MSLYRKVIKFFNLKIPQVGRSMEQKAPDIIRDGVRNDFPDYLIETVFDSPHGSSAMEILYSFIEGRGLSEDLKGEMVNDDDTWGDLHAKVSKDMALVRRFALKVVATAGGGIDQIYHIPFEAVRYGIPDEKSGEIEFVAVNYKFNQQDFKTTETKYYPLFSPSRRFDNVREEVDKLMIRYGQEYYGHVWFWTETGPKNRVYSRPSYFACHPELRTDAKVGIFHERNTDNNFFLGGIISVVGDPNQGIYEEGDDSEDAVPYTTVGEEFDKQLASTFSGADNAGRIMIDWNESPEDMAKVQAWPGSSNHEQYVAQEKVIQERISISFGVPMVLFGVPTAGKLGDNQEIRNAIKFTNEKTRKQRGKLDSVYSVLMEMMGISVGDEMMIKEIRDWTDLPEWVVAQMGGEQVATYLEESYGVERVEEEEIEEEEEVNPLIEEEDADLSDIEE